MNGNLIKLLNGVKVSKKADDGTNIWGDPEHHRMIKVQKWTTAAAASSLPKLAASTAANQAATPMSAPVLTGGLKSPILGAAGSEQQSSNADLFNPSTTSGTTGSGSPTSAVTTPSSAPVTSTTPPSWMAPTVASASVNKPTSSWNNTPAAAPPLLQQQQMLQQQLMAANGENNATGGDEIRSWHDRDAMSAGGGADQSQAHHHMQQKPWISNNFREVCF